MKFVPGARRLMFVAGVALASLGLFPLRSLAEDRILVLAGGYSASGNQASLERNVHFFRKVVDETALAAPVTEYFSSGNEKIRSVQFKPANAKVPSANEYMARLFGSTSNLKLSYRHHELGGSGWNRVESESRKVVRGGGQFDESRRSAPDLCDGARRQKPGQEETVQHNPLFLESPNDRRPGLAETTLKTPRGSVRGSGYGAVSFRRIRSLDFQSNRS